MLALAIVASALSPVPASGAPGDLDPTFSGDGIASTTADPSNVGVAVVRQPDGKLVIGGEASTNGRPQFAVARFNADGTLDTTFSFDGKVVTSDLGNANNPLNAIALQPDGKIVAAGSTSSIGVYPDFGVVRYTASGAHDTTFDGDGKVTTHFTQREEANAVLVQPDGKIVVGGFVGDASLPDFGVARYNPNGSLDTSFDGDGKAVSSITTRGDWAYGMVLQPDGKIVLAGHSFNGSNYDLALVRFLPNGALDPSFDGDGQRVVPAFAAHEWCWALALQPDGKFVLAGQKGIPPNEDVLLARIDADGSVDTSFGADGMVVTAIGSGNDVANSVAVQADGKIVVGGVTQNGSNDDSFVLRYDASGHLDPTFGGGDGIVITPLGAPADFGVFAAGGILVQPDGRIVQATTARPSVTTELTLVRYQNQVCGNGALEAGEVCDDGNGSSGDCCSASCQLETGSCTSDGVACTVDVCSGAACQHLPDPAACGDGLFCNGVETCDALLGCQAGTPPAADDGVACTDEVCDEAADAVIHVPSDAACDDDLFCDGVETCDAVLGCLAGAPPATDDGVACTADACDEASDAITHTPSNVACGDGLYCNGVETCNAVLGCLAGVPPATDDGIACTADACDEASDSITHTPSHAACGDGLYCNGVETCDAQLGCRSGTPPATDDGIACTTDACDEASDAITHTPSDAACGDGLYCNGVETCDAQLGCRSGTPPATDDGIACTTDACDEASDAITHTPSDAACGDGLYCNGVETCDAQLGCRNGTAPATDDGVACTADACDEASDTITHTPSDAACGDGLYCNGVETCDPQLGCRAGLPPEVDDGVACTLDGCDESSDQVTHVADDELCADTDSCTADACDPLLGCTNTPTTDSDGDDVCDAQDPCTAVVPATVHRATLKMTRVGAPSGDDTLSIAGMIRFPQPIAPPLDPVDRGLRILLEDQATGTIVDASVAGGAYDRATRTGWKANRQGTSWTYSNPASGAAISTVSLRLQSGRLTFGLKGRSGSYALPTPPLKATLVLDPPRAMLGQCAEMTWPGSVPGGQCAIQGTAQKVTCR